MPGQGLLAGTAIVVQSPQRQGAGDLLTLKEAAKTDRNPASSATNGSPKGELKDFESSNFTPCAAQPGHAASPVVGNPGFDETFRYTKGS